MAVVVRDASNKLTEPDGKTRYGQALRAIDRLMAKRLSRQDVAQLAATSDKLAARDKDRSQFENEVLAFLVKEFVKAGDRESLVGLLSKRCPSRIDVAELIEFYLAFVGQKLKDPILIFGEAYAKCQVPETRHLLADAVRRAFAGFGIHGDDDAGFVRNAMQWYERHKERLVVNQGYVLNEISNGGAFTIGSYDANPEFYDHPPYARDPLFKRNAGSPGRGLFYWLLLTSTALIAGIMVALIAVRVKARRARSVAQ